MRYLTHDKRRTCAPALSSGKCELNFISRLQLITFMGTCKCTKKNLMVLLINVCYRVLIYLYFTDWRTRTQHRTNQTSAFKHQKHCLCNTPKQTPPGILCLCPHPRQFPQHRQLRGQRHRLQTVNTSQRVGDPL